MAEELVVREPFQLPGSSEILQRGQHIADPAVIAAVRESHGHFVRRIVVPDAPAPEQPSNHMAEG